MKTTRIRIPRLAWSLLSSILALSLMLGLALVLARYQALAQSATSVAADLEILKEVHSTQAAPGDTLFYTITIRNNSVSAVDVQVTDTLPPLLVNASAPAPLYGDAGIASNVITWTCTLYPLSQNQLTFDAQIISGMTAYAEIVNTAQLSGGGEIYTSVVTTTAVADIGDLDNASTYKTVSAETAEPGDVLEYTVWVRNDQARAVPEAQFSDQLPEGLILVGTPTALVGQVSVVGNGIAWSYDVPPLGSDMITYTAQVDPDLPADRWITNTAQFSTPGQEFTRTATISVHKRMGLLAASKSVAPRSARPLEYLTYTVHLENNGDGNLGGLWMTDALPSEVTLVNGSLSASRGSLGAAGNVITWTIMTDPEDTLLLPSEEITITYSVQINADLSHSPFFTNTAEITGAGSLVTAQAQAQAITSFDIYLPVFTRNYLPVTVINAIPAPVNASYTVSWRDLDLVPTDHYYELQQSLGPDFTSIKQTWSPLKTTSQNIQSAICAYYYRVRAVSPSAWGNGPWTAGSLAQPSPPTVDLNDIDNASNNRSYTVSWVAPSIEVQQYELQESKDPEFGTLTGQWTIASGTSKAITKSSGESGTFYYRVRADDDDCWGEGPWSVVKSTSIYTKYDFNTACPSWAVREHTGDDGPPGTDWFNVYCADGYLKMWMDDRWEHIVASPLVIGPDVPYEIQAKIFFYIRKWTHGYAFIFGSDEAFTRYYRVNVVYLQEGVMKYQIKRCYKDNPNKEKVLTMDLPGADSGGYIELSTSILNGKEWTNWNIRRDGDHIKVYVNTHLLADVTDDYYTGEGYFGMMLSTWEFKPAEIWVDYFNIVPIE